MKKIVLSVTLSLMALSALAAATPASACHWWRHDHWHHGW
jgi:hypothetical protein